MQVKLLLFGLCILFLPIVSALTLNVTPTDYRGFNVDSFTLNGVANTMLPNTEFISQGDSGHTSPFLVQTLNVNGRYEGFTGVVSQPSAVYTINARTVITLLNGSIYTLDCSGGGTSNSCVLANPSPNASVYNVSFYVWASSATPTVTVTGNASIPRGVALFNVSNGLRYNLTVDNASYAVYRTEYLATSSAVQSLSPILQPNNAIFLYIKNELTGANIYGNTSLQFAGDFGTVFTSSINQSGLYKDLAVDNYTITVTQAGYSSRNYRVNIQDRTSQNLSIYLNNGTAVLFNVKTASGAALPGATLQVFAYVGGSKYLVESKTSDVSGQVQMSLVTGTLYEFNASLSGYDTYYFVLNPVLFTSYDVTLSPTASQSVQPSALLYFSPTNFFKYQRDSIKLQFVSQYNSLTYYAYSLKTPITSYNGSGTSSDGQTFTHAFNFANASSGNVSLYYNYTLSDGSFYQHYQEYPIVFPLSNRTWTTMGQDSQDLGLLAGDRVLIVTIITIVLFGVGWLAFGTGAGLLLAIINIMFFINSNFVPGAIYYVTIIVAVVILISRGVSDG